jgi:signal transduction histidine kinase
VRIVRGIGKALATMGMSLAATIVLIACQAERSITLLVYLPGIAVAEALFGFGAGVAAVFLSALASAAYRIWFLPLQNPAGAGGLDRGFDRMWEGEIILIAVGLFVVALMEDRRRSGARAAVNARQLAAILEHSADAVFIFDRRFRVASMNPAAHALLDRPGETLVGESAASLRERFQFSGDPAVMAMTLEQAMRAGRPVRAQGSVLDVAHNRRLQVLISAVPWYDLRRRLAGSVVLLTDLTTVADLRQRALEDARQLAAAQMFSGLTHDFNHVLDIVRRAASVLALQEDAPAAERRKYLEMIDRAARQGSLIVRRLRDYLAGGGPLAPLDLAAVAHDAFELTRPLWRTRPALEMIEDLHPVPAVVGSAADLQRVIVNLIFNAIEALGNQPGRVVIHTEPSSDSPPGARAWVEDTGPGVPQAARARLFEPYFTTKPQGMGLGLFGARNIAIAHGGSLRFVSPPGRGARFVLEIPARPVAETRRNSV